MHLEAVVSGVQPADKNRIKTWFFNLEEDLKKGSLALIKWLYRLEGSMSMVTKAEATLKIYVPNLAP